MSINIHESIKDIDFSSSKYESVRIIPYFIVNDVPIFGFISSHGGSILTIGGKIENTDFNCFSALLREIKEETKEYLSIQEENILSSFAIENLNVLFLITPIYYPRTNFESTEEANGFIWLSLPQLKILIQDFKKKINDPYSKIFYINFSRYFVEITKEFFDLPFLENRTSVDNDTILIQRSNLNQEQMTLCKISQLKDYLEKSKIHGNSILISSVSQGALIYIPNQKNCYYLIEFELIDEIKELIYLKARENFHGIEDLFFNIEDRNENYFEIPKITIRRDYQQFFRDSNIKNLEKEYFLKKELERKSDSIEGKKIIWEELLEILKQIEERCYDLRKKNLEVSAEVKKVRLTYLNIVNFVNKNLIESRRFRIAPEYLKKFEFLLNRKLWKVGQNRNLNF